MHFSLAPIVIVLLVAVLTVIVCRRLNIPSMLGYLLVGFLAGPGVLHLIPQTAATDYLGEIGIVFLMFSIGLEFSLPKLRAMRKLVFGLGGMQVVITIVSILGILMLAGTPFIWAFAVAGALTMSSTAIVSRILSEKTELGQPHGQMAMGVLLMQDIAVVPLMILPGILIQKPLAKLASEGMREGAIRNATLVEAVQGIEDIKLLRAESRFQNQWNHMNEVSADISMRQRKLVGVMTAWTQKIQGLTFAIVVLVGCFAVMKGEMTTGALVACSILSSRMLGPIAQISGVLGRLQQAKVAKTSLDELMKKPVDQPPHSHLIHRPALLGHYELNGTVFKYSQNDAKPTLAIQKLEIKAGEKIAVLGRNGAGKSTLLQLLSGMQEPVQGKIKLDGVDLGLIDPSDVRRDMGLLNQNAHLFFGSVRENLKLGAPLATDQEILEALKITGALDFVQEKKEGLDHQILEGGAGFSGGQRQALLLARLLLRQPSIVLLDEPTASLDDVSEQQLIQQLKGWLGQKTLVIATHRRAVLELVDRIIVLHDGKIVMDGPKEQILQQSTSNQAGAA